MKKRIKLSSKHWYSFQNGAKITEETKQRWLDESVEELRKTFKKEPYKKKDNFSIACGDSQVIVCAFKNKDGTFFVRANIYDSSGIREYVHTNFKLL